QLFMHRVQRRLRRLALRRIGLVGNDEEQPPFGCGMMQGVDHFGQEPKLFGTQRRAPFAVFVLDQRIDDAVAVEKERFIHRDSPPSTDRENATAAALKPPASRRAEEKRTTPRRDPGRASRRPARQRGWWR